MVVAMYALAGNAGSTPADDIYTHAGDFNDVTSGSDGSCSPAYLCTAETGLPDYADPTDDDPSSGQTGAAVFSWRDDYLATSWLSDYSRIQEQKAYAG